MVSRTEASNDIGQITIDAGVYFQSGLRPLLLGIERDSIFVSLVLGFAVPNTILFGFGPLHGIVIASVLSGMIAIGNTVKYEGLSVFGIFGSAFFYQANFTCGFIFGQASKFTVELRRTLKFGRERVRMFNHRVRPDITSDKCDLASMKTGHVTLDGLCSQLYSLTSDKSLIFDPIRQRVTAVFELSHATTPYLMGLEAKMRLAESFARGLDRGSRFASKGISFSVIEIPNGQNNVSFNPAAVNAAVDLQNEAAFDPSTDTNTDTTRRAFARDVLRLYAQLKEKRLGPKSYFSVSISVKDDSLGEFETVLAQVYDSLFSTARVVVGSLSGSVHLNSLGVHELSSLVARLSPKTSNQGRWASFVGLDTEVGTRVIYSVARWPRIRVRPAFMQTIFLARSSVVAVISEFVPVPTRQAMRFVRTNRTNALVNTRLRETNGYLEGRSHSSRYVALLELEQYLAAGRSAYGIETFVIDAPDSSVSIRTVDLFRDVGVELKREFGRQNLCMLRLLGVGTNQ